MTLPAIIQATRENTVQSQPPVTPTGSPFGVFNLVLSGTFVPPWWSQKRDISLRKFWKSGDHIAGAVYTMIAKMTAIPVRVMARDPSVRQHVKEAEAVTEMLRGSAQFGEGWENFLGMCVEDLLCTDNGMFIEVIGPGNAAGPLTGRAISLAHLDSVNCRRTGNWEYPVVYFDKQSEKYYKLHWTRIMYSSQMSSPISDMHGVGFCGLSRAINVAQTLIDILQFKQEKLGSRPHRGLIVTQGGLDPQDVASAFQIAESQMDNASLSRYSKIVVIGSASMPEAKLEKVELSSLPDGFDEQTSLTLGMASIALAFGVDARELFPSMQSGATRADALLAHLKQRGKGPGQIISTIEQLVNTKFLPPHLYFEFDFQDDAQDRQAADIRNVRATRRTQDLNTGALTVSTSRRLMVQDRDLDEGLFEQMELQDGRLPDGTPLLTLFYSDDPAYKKYLDLGTDDPLDITQNDAQAIMTAVHEQMVEAARDVANLSDPQKRRIANQCLMALAKLEKYYLEPKPLYAVLLNEEVIPTTEQPDQRTRNQNLAEPNPREELNPQGRDGMEQSSDDNVANAGDPNRGAK